MSLFLLFFPSSVGNFRPMHIWKLLPILLGLSVVASALAAPNLKTVGIYVGNNSFPGLRTNDLRGCINDANRYADAFQKVLGNVEGRLLINSSVEQFKQAFQQAVVRCRSGEIGRLILTISSHGTSWPSADGRSATQAIIFSDVNESMTVGLLADSTFRGMLDQIPATVGVELLLDTCYSGGVTRDVMGSRTALQWNPRYVPHPRFRPGLQTLKPRALRSLEVEHMAQWAACSESQTSADAFLGGDWHGAFTYVWVRNFLLRRDQPRSALLQAVQNELAPGYRQNPQLLTE